MGFFAEFSAWLDRVLARYISDNTHNIAAALEPAVVTLGVLYVMVWGALHMLGQIEQPLLAGLKRIALIALVFGVGLNLWLYNDVIVDAFYNGPAQLSAAIVGAYDSVTVVDRIILSGDDTGALLLSKGGIIHGFSYVLAGFVVYFIVGFVAVYTMFLLALSKVALSILLALGPLFIALLFFEATKRFVEAWFAQLANYAFVAILTVLAAALMLSVLQQAADQAVAAGGGIQLAQAVRVCLAGGLTLLIMRQVPPMAAGLASGIALSSFGAVSGLLRGGAGALGQFTRGALMDRETSRWDSLSRKSGHYVRRGVVALAKRARRGNSVRAT
jgi:type IV secretion system protein VirB6